jgi:hypothetical protein
VTAHLVVRVAALEGMMEARGGLVVEQLPRQVLVKVAALLLALLVAFFRAEAGAIMRVPVARVEELAAAAEGVVEVVAVVAPARLVVVATVLLHHGKERYEICYC